MTRGEPTTSGNTTRPTEEAKPYPPPPARNKDDNMPESTIRFLIYQDEDYKWRISQGDPMTGAWSGAIRSKPFDTFREAGDALIEWYESAERIAKIIASRRRGGS